MRGTCLALLLLAACVSTEQTVEPDSTPERLLERGEEHFAGRRYDEALRAFQMAALGSQPGALDRNRERGILVRSLAGAAQVHAVRGDLAEAERWLEQAEVLLEGAGSEARCATLLARGLVQQEGAEPRAALASFEQLFRLAQSEGFDARAVQAAHMASVVTQGEEQLAWTRRALDATGEREVWRGPLLNALGWMYDRLGRFAEALQAFGEARELAATYGGSHARLVADWHYGRALRRIGRLDEARVLMLRTLARAQDRYVAGRTPNDAEWLGRCYLERAEIERIDLGLVASSPDPQPEEVARLREAAQRDFTRARRLFLEAGAAQSAPDLIARADEALAELTRN